MKSAHTTPKIENGKRVFEPTQTMQQFKESSNINTIVKKIYQGIPVPKVQHGQYGYFDQTHTLAGALETINQATVDFYKLPASVRAEFNNRPMEYLQASAEQPERLAKVGILGEKLKETFNPPAEKPAEPAPVKHEPVQEHVKAS